MVRFAERKFGRGLCAVIAALLTYFLSVGNDGTPETFSVAAPQAVRDLILATSNPPLSAFPVPAAFLVFAVCLLGLLLVSQEKNRRSKSA